MGQITQEVLKQVEAYVTDFFKNQEHLENYKYHSLDHTRYVVKAVKEIAKGENFTDEEVLTISVAAWFHDIGYFEKPEKHELRSVAIAFDFLKDKNIDSEQLDIIQHAILKTNWPQTPDCKFSRVMCDADLKHLSDPNYFEFTERLRLELSFIKNKEYKKKSFLMLNQAFFEHHDYFTEYAKHNFNEGKSLNAEKIAEKVKKANTKGDLKAIEKLNTENEKLKKKLEKASGYSRGVESMFRLTARNQINLSSIADNKSNILITVNTIIISILVSTLVRKFDESPELIIPTLTFLAFSLVTIIFAILSTRPNISSGKFSEEDIKANKVNLLFFGNFYNMKLDEYEWAVEELMKNDGNLYSTMIKDQYLLGRVLAKKYKLLRWAYNLFMIGIITSVILFILSQLGL